jgi:MarR family 2-MHQ and catechol resistance regulon transcriptional repressor
MTSQVLSDQTNLVLRSWTRLLRGHAGLTRELSAALHDEHGLTINDYEALLLLSHATEGHLRRIDLAAKLLLTASGVTRLLDGLEASGWVETAACPGDARVKFTMLTAAGRAKLESASCSHVAAVCAAFEQRYSPKELERLAELLERLPGAGEATSCTP